MTCNGHINYSRDAVGTNNYSGGKRTKKVKQSTRRLRYSRAAMGITYTTQTAVVLNPGLRGDLLPFVTADRVPEQNTMKIVC